MQNEPLQGLTKSNYRLQLEACGRACARAHARKNVTIVHGTAEGCSNYKYYEEIQQELEGDGTVTLT